MENIHWLSVASRADAWIETASVLEGGGSGAVASRADAWIETPSGKATDSDSAVASRADAWIETLCLMSLILLHLSRPARTRGLKHYRN